MNPFLTQLVCSQSLAGYLGTSVPSFLLGYFVPKAGLGNIGLAFFRLVCTGLDQRFGLCAPHSLPAAERLSKHSQSLGWNDIQASR